MIISRCCKKPVYVLYDYYVCDACDLACDTLNIGRLLRDFSDDTRGTTETKKFDNLS